MNQPQWSRVPPAPSLVSPSTRQLADQSLRQQPAASQQLPSPAAPPSLVCGEPKTAPAALPEGADAQLAPFETGPASQAAASPRNASIAAETAAAAIARPDATMVLETRLAALESQVQTKLAQLEALESRDAAQTDVLRQITATVEASHGGVTQLQQVVRTQHQQDVESLKQLSHTLERLIETEPAAIDPEGE
jgi:uncharacterized coiled-coil protein SlyX